MVAKRAQDPSLKVNVVGRAAPTSKNPEPKIYRMKLFSKNEVVAKSKFWYFMKKLNKARKSDGEILACKEIHESKPKKIKNFAVWLRYDSRTGTHNMYKEYRSLTQNEAISQMYAEMTGRHRAQHSSIQVIRIAEIPASMCRRPHVIQLNKPNLKFPLIRQLPIGPKRFQKTFAPKRVSTFFK